METLNLFNIEFPVYPITSSYKKIYEDMRVTYIDTEFRTYVLDNKNVAGATLGERRLHIVENEGFKIYNHRHTYFTIAQFLKSQYKVFIDSDGKVFRYKKTQYVPLIYHKVAEVIRLDDEQGCVITLNGVVHSIKMNCRKAYSINYVGILHTPYGYIEYSFEEEHKKSTRKMI